VIFLSGKNYLMHSGLSLLGCHKLPLIEQMKNENVEGVETLLTWQ
jgi:hypothetical protein